MDYSSGMKARDIFVHGLLLVLFGVFVPYIKGIEFLDILILAPYACLGFLFLAPVIVDDAFANDKQVTLHGLARGIAFGWGSAAAMIILGLATVNFTLPRRVLPPATILLSLGILSLLFSVLVGAAAAAVAQRSQNVQQAKGRLRIGFLILLCAFFSAPHVLSEELLNQLLSLSVAEKLARFTLIASPLLAIAGVLAIAAVVRRGKLAIS